MLSSRLMLSTSVRTMAENYDVHYTEFKHEDEAL